MNKVTDSEVAEWVGQRFGQHYKLHWELLPVSRREKFRQRYEEAQTQEGKPQVTRIGVLDMQVCVPEDWKDPQVLKFANTENPCGTRAGWQIRKAGSPYLLGDPERCPCCERPKFVHIMLDA